ncbi:MAG: TrkH family potassium uptake protein [Alphaproteobacteria bacterium]|nr:TrkH family potassium uptake protein [Alphaproteobacteria bacterium]
MDFRPVMYVIGILLCILAAGMVIPMLADLYDGDTDWKVFLLCIVMTAFFGGSLILSNHHPNVTINTRQAFLLTTLSWLAIAAFGALPFFMSRLQMSFADSFFESMSGITTTGSTVITDLQHTPRGILLWRAMLQWLGGIGFIVMAMSILPMLKVGGMKLFRTESSESEKALPKAAHLARSIGGVYIGLTALCAMFYMMADMTFFEGIVHAMTTLSTGGFSTADSSFAYFNSALIEFIGIVFMILGGLPFVLYIRAMRGNISQIFQDTQVRWFLGVVAFTTFALVLHSSFQRDISLFTAIEHALFNVVSIITTTGFVSDDYSLWGGFAFSMFFMLTFVGACAGSTSGGIKIFRSQVLFDVVKVQIKKLIYPNGVFTPKYNGRPIPEDVTLSVMGFFFMYVLILGAGVTILSYIGLDFTTALSGTATAISNVGPGFGDIIGPTGTFAPLPDSAKWVLSMLMLLGRLEIFTVLVLFSKYFWQK